MFRFIALLCLLLVSATSSGAVVTVQYSWDIAYVSDPAADVLLGQTVAGTLTLDEETVATGSGLKRYHLLSHTINVDGTSIPIIGERNQGGDKRNSVMVINNLYGESLGDAVIVQSTVDSSYSGFQLQTFGLVLSDTDSSRLDSASITKTALDASFELTEGRLLLTLGGNEITVASQGQLALNTSTDSTPPASLSYVMDCPDTPSSSNATRDWTVCDVKSSVYPEFTANTGQDYLMSYAVPKVLSPTNKGRIKIYMHPSSVGDLAVSGTFTGESDEIQIRVTEQMVYTGNSGNWWAYSGYNQSPSLVDNYNGKILAAAVDYILENYGDIVDLNKGIELTGASLGGAGSYIQSQILPKYQAYVATASSFYGIMNMIEAPGSPAGPGWGTLAQSPALYASTDLTQNTELIKNIHFHWAGGQNDGLGRMSDAFMDMCDSHKISCSMRWLQSGHGVNEAGYDLPHEMWQDPDKDVTLDKILPVITNNTSNHRATLRGYINYGMTWDHDNITETATTITIPLKYDAKTGIGPDLPDQPNTATFSVTPRHISTFLMTPGANVDWTFGAQNGTAVVDAEGLVTIDGLTLTSGAGYTNLVLTHGTNPIVQNSIVYTKVPRTTGTYTVTRSGTDYDIDYADLWDYLPESGRPFYNFKGPGNLVIRTPAGVETVIHDCITPNTPCVPMDPAVSPDGKKIAYALMSSSTFVKAWYDGVTLPQDLLSSVGAEASIHVYDIETQITTSWPHTPGDRDSGPAWLPDGRIMFTSTRQGHIQPYLPRGIATNGAYGSSPQPRLHIADADGTNVEDIGQHELTQALHPVTMSSGRVMYSSHWLSHNLPYFGNSGSINWPTTLANMWALQDVDYKGGDMAALLGGHRNTFTASNGRTKTLKVLHLHGERSNGDICVDNYYRSNNFGLGDIFCWPPEPKGVEGEPNSFLPRNIYTAFEWSKSNDEPSFTYSLLNIGDQSTNYLGKVGWPEGTADGQIMATVCRGYCSQISSNIPAVGTTLSGRETTDIGIYKTTVIPSLVPEDLEVVVNDPNFHEFGAREIRARTITMPVLSTTGTAGCELISTDVGSAETSHHTSHPYDFNKNYRTSANNGGEIDGLNHNDVVGIKFFEPIPRSVGDSDPANVTGGLMKIIGTVPLLADKSFKVQLPCDTPYLMAGVDANDRVIKRDQVAQSLRPGEKRICTGCHLHSTEGRAYSASDAFSATAFDLTAAAVAAPTYTADIKPILDNKCASCHNPADPSPDDVDLVPLWTYDGLVTDFAQLQVPTSMRVQLEPSGSDTKMHGFQRPYLSKYVNSMFARESLLYWKAVNARTDGRTDSTYSDDVDFGADHPTTLTQSEINLIADWLDTGATK